MINTEYGMGGSFSAKDVFEAAQGKRYAAAARPLYALAGNLAEADIRGRGALIAADVEAKAAADKTAMLGIGQKQISDLGKVTLREKIGQWDNPIASERWGFLMK